MLQLKGEILVVEDQPGLLTLYKQMLETAGLKAHTAGDADSAMALFERHQSAIDLIIMDCQLHETSGFDVYRNMLEVRDGLKVIFCSGLPEAKLLAELEPDWQMKVLLKPFKTKELLSVVAGMLGQVEQIDVN